MTATATETRESIRRELLVEPGTPARLAERSSKWTDGGVYADLSPDDLNATRESQARAGR